MTAQPTPTKAALISDINDLLNAIGAKLQLSSTAYDEASRRYKSVSEWLNAPESALHKFTPDIFPQGSLRICTTVKPRGKDEFDLDFVLVLNASVLDFPDPIVLLDMVEARLRSNKMYEGMIERKNRCIRINYAKQFHMDIIPACPAPRPYELYGEHIVKVPDCDLDDWTDSNPKGYPLWFENQAKIAGDLYRKSIAPLPEQQAFEELAVLQRVVQLMKRNRDVALEKINPKERPISIVLTTLAGLYYNGSPSVLGALEHILFNIRLHFGGQRLVILNPTNREEDFTERWDANPHLYKIFQDWVIEFSNALATLRQTEGLPEKAELLKAMFGERVTNVVVEDYYKRMTEGRKQGEFSTARGAGVIVTSDTATGEKIPYNNHHGDEQ